jgi:hypothetical protein
MTGKMNPGQKRVSKQIRDFCKEHAYKCQFDFKLFALNLYNGNGHRLALCESGVVIVHGGAVIDNWREYPTRTLQQLLNAANRLLKKQQKEKKPVPTERKSPMTTGTCNFVSINRAIDYYMIQECPGEINRTEGLKKFKHVREDDAEYIRWAKIIGDMRHFIDEKIKAKEIAIGPPDLKSGESWRINDEGRYVITN